jgi:hypothetical protein
VSDPTLFKYSFDSVGEMLPLPAPEEQAEIISTTSIASCVIFGCIQMIIAILYLTIKEFRGNVRVFID